MGMRLVRLTALGASVVLMTACWEMPGQGPDRRSHNAFEEQITAETVGTLAEAWSTDVGELVSAPVLSSGRVHVTTDNDNGNPELVTLASATGAVNWSEELDETGIGVAGDVVVRGAQAIVGYGHPAIGGQWTATVFDAATGDRLGDVAQGIVSTRREAFVGLTSYGYGSDGTCGSSIRVADLDDPAFTWDAVISASDVGDCVDPVALTLGTSDVVHAGMGPALDENGELQFGVNAIRSYGFPVPQECPPPGGGPLVACPDWATELDGETATVPVISEDGGTLYTGTDAGTLYAVDRATGTIEWLATLGVAITSPPAVANGTVFVPTASGDLMTLGAAGCGAPVCGPLWVGSTGSYLTVQPAVAGGVVFTGSANGTMAAFPAAGCGAGSCASLWAADTGSSVTGAPAVSGGRLYVGTLDGLVIAYAPSSG